MFDEVYTLPSSFPNFKEMDCAHSRSRFYIFSSVQLTDSAIDYHDDIQYEFCGVPVS